MGKCHVRAVCATLYFPPELRSKEENAESHIHWTRNLHSQLSTLARNILSMPGRCATLVTIHITVEFGLTGERYTSSIPLGTVCRNCFYLATTDVDFFLGSHIRVQL